ncbi:(2Fe-2S)-binding protein [Streptomyces sp. NPDC096105]|uniref:(2Fe-2S)-binding protein n=1 Tax=Streptomyces sp. NPDC096105 TaxID=3366074 RepID=UPI00381382D5
MDLDPRLTALRDLGGFFSLRAGEEAGRRLPTLAHAYGPHRPDGQGAPRSAPLSEPLSAPLTDPLTGPDVLADPLTARVRRVAAALRTREPRVAASVAHQGLAARLWSVALGCAALYGAVPDLAPETVRWDPEGSAPDDLWLAGVRPLPGDAASLADIVLHGHLEPLSAALRARHRVAPALLRGNAASALAAAARELARHARPEAAARAARLSRELLAHPLLSGAGSLTAAGFRRRSCCLYYRVPGGGVCGDCCFVRPPRSSPRAPSA